MPEHTKSSEYIIIRDNNIADNIVRKITNV